MPVISIKVRIPKASDHEKIIESKLKKLSIENVSASVFASTGTIECSYNKKTLSYISKYRLERELKAALEKMGYKVQFILTAKNTMR